MDDSDPLAPPQSAKEWRLIEKVLMANTVELRRMRRWGNFFKLLGFLYLFIILMLVVSAQRHQTSGLSEPTGGHTAVVRIDGPILDGSEASSAVIIGGLKAAFEHSDTQAVVLRINSPGGSPVQAEYVFNEIKRLRDIHQTIPLYAVIVDTGASGAYYIAAAADEIYASPASIVGSIGVTAAGFGFDKALEKLGIERRQFTAGEHKSFLDPFAPLNEDEKQLYQALLSSVHQQFIQRVKQGRGDRLVEDPKLFSGLVWSGEQALALGLIDGFQSTAGLARELGYSQLLDFTPKQGPVEQWLERLGVSMGKGIASRLAIETGLH